MNKLKVFLSARTRRKDEMRECRNVLRGEGFDVQSSWLDTGGATFDADIELVAVTCINDVRACDVLVAFTEGDGRGGGKGGRHVEYGIALALRKVIIVAGPLEHIFHYYPYATRCEDGVPYLGQLVTFLHYAQSLRFDRGEM